MTKFRRSLQGLELALVGLFTASARRPASLGLARTITRLGNLWIYLPIALALLVFDWLRGLAIIVTALCNVALLQSVYKPLKRWISRPRPFQISAQLQSALPTLDEHSFPSGHIMMLTGVLTPILLVFPSLLGLCVLLWIVMAWARVATAHHFVSDVLGGTLIAFLIAYPASLFLLHHIQKFGV